MSIRENTVTAVRVNIHQSTTAGKITSGTINASALVHKTGNARTYVKPLALQRAHRHYAKQNPNGRTRHTGNIRGPRRANERVRHVTFVDQSDLTTALAGGDAALNQLVNTLAPVIQARVARRLFRSSASKDVRQDVKDLTQEIFLHLFENDARVLHAWDPERGMSLENYVGLVAERRTISHFRSGKSNPWREQENLDNVQEPYSENSNIEHQVMNEDTLITVLQLMRERLSPLGWRLFDLLYIQEQSIEQIQKNTNMKADAIYAWRSRLRKTARQCQQQLLTTCLTKTEQA